MKTLKPPNMGILLKAVSIADSYHLCVGACACFTLDVKAPNRLFDEPDIWPMIEAALDKEELFDFGVPKIRGEYLVYGSAFSTRPVRALETAVRVGSLSKNPPGLRRPFIGPSSRRMPRPLSPAARPVAKRLRRAGIPGKPPGQKERAKMPRAPAPPQHSGPGTSLWARRASRHRRRASPPTP
jgi:hypothetical protein